MAESDVELEKKQIAVNIRTLRKEKKLSQIELAKRIGVSSQVISNWERAYTTPTAYDIQKITHALEIGPDKIIPGITSEEFEAYINNSTDLSDVFVAMMHLLGEEFIENLANKQIDIEKLLKKDIDFIYKEKKITESGKQKLLEIFDIITK